MNKLVVILGPTSTGKTSLAIKLCQRFNGEIVSADSRQIYKYMDIGTGKVPTQKSNVKCQSHMLNVKTDGVAKGEGYWIIDGVYIHLYDVAEPDGKFSVARFKDAAVKEIQSIWRREKTPFLVGGTGFYLAAVLGEAEFPRVPPNWELRRRLEKLSNEELFDKLKELDPERARTVDPRNPRRLIRAVEVAAASGLPRSPRGTPDLLCFKGRAPYGSRRQTAQPPFAVLKIGLTAPREILYRRADDWAAAIVNHGLLEEVQDLINRGYKDSPPMKGIIYKTAVEHLAQKLTKEEMLQRIKYDLHGYIRRQLTWFKRDQEIRWFDISKTGFDVRVENLIESFLKDA